MDLTCLISKHVLTLFEKKNFPYTIDMIIHLLIIEENGYEKKK